MSHVIILQIGPEGQPPTEFRIFAMGDNESSKGTVKLDAESVAALMAAWAKHGMDKMPIDYGHGMVFRDDHRSAGWADLEVRDDGLWAVNVEWTPQAEQHLRDREFRFVSPAFMTDKKGRVVELLNVALTNIPATRNAIPLVAHYLNDPGADAGEPQAPERARRQPMSEKLFKALGAADEGEALVIATEINAWTKQVLATTGAANLDDAVKAIEANAKLPALVKELSDQIAAHDKAAEQIEHEALIKQLSDDGKLPPSMHDWARSQPLDSLKAFGQVAPVLGAKAAPKDSHQEPAQRPVVLSDEDKKAALLMGMSEEDMVAERRAELEREAPAGVLVITAKE